MEINRMKSAVIACCCFALANSCYATGGDSFEYEAKLSDTLDMLPGKSLGEIFLETSKMPAAKGPLEYEGPARDLVNRLGKEPMPQLLKAADELIAQARLHYADGTKWCNLAHDIRDAVAVSGDNPEAARDYLNWRLKSGAGIDENSADLDQRAEAAKGLIKANWLYACGAKRFSSGDRTECQEWFDRVVKEFPKHPRAEIAMFMSARCAFSASRAEPNDPDALANARGKAAAKFEEFRKHYPRGRFDADALGWLGALAFDAQDYLKALDFYIAQAETPGHPETLVTAIYNCERTLARLAPNPGGDAAFALIARHPRIAMAFTYLVLSAPEADNYDGKWDNPADVRKWRRAILPRIAAAVAKQKEAYKSGDWQPRYLAMLVHAASAAGNHAQALQLSQISPEQLKRSEDLLFARAIALQRANKTREAIEALQTFLQTFPESLITPGVKIRLAIALQDNHQAGEAIVLLHELLPKSDNAAEPSPSPQESADEDEQENEADADSDETGNDSEEKPTASDILGTRYTEGESYPDGEREWELSESAVYPNIAGADEEQIGQFIDTLLNFAPLPELVATPDNENLEQKTKQKFRAVLAERYLAAENFAEAKKYIADPGRLELVRRLEQLTTDNSGSVHEKAQRMLELGDAWAKARGVLLRAPLDTELHNGYPIPGLMRRENGHALSLTNVEDQLDDRDELHHASRWWMRAARTLPGTPVAAKARLKALEALPQIARVSSYTEQRAREIKLEAVSREIYDKLRAESPSSPEAQRFAAYWSVPPVPKQNDQMPSGLSESDQTEPVTCGEQTAFGYPISDNNAFDAVSRGNSEGEEQERSRIWQDIEKRMAVLRDASATTEITELAQLARKNMGRIEDASTANCLDDLAQFLAEPELPREARSVYVNLRLDLLHRTHWPDSPVDPGISVKDSDDAVEAEIGAAEKNPALKSFHDYLDFCRIGLIAGNRIEKETDIHDAKDLDHPVTYYSRDYVEMEKMTREFLGKYPRSHKREAALFVLARATYSLSRPYIACVGVRPPGAAPDDVVDVAQKSYRAEPFNRDRVMKALDDYDREFPNGRYAADVRDMRAATLWRMQQWDKALDLTLAQIADKTNLDLLGNAETRLANIFAELANVEHRPQLLDAIRGRPAAVPYLAAYVAAATNNRAHPLRYLQRYLSDQLQFKIPPPSPESSASN